MSAAVLAFPPRNIGRIRRSRSMSAAGVLSLRLLAREGVDVPPNIVRIRRSRSSSFDPTMPARSPGLLLALLIYTQLDDEPKQAVQQLVRAMAFDDDPEAAQLCRLFAARRCP